MSHKDNSRNNVKSNQSAACIFIRYNMRLIKMYKIYCDLNKIRNREQYKGFGYKFV